jgi:hypothetical protein
MPSAGQQLAQWIEAQHPEFFAQLHAGVTRGVLARSQRRARLGDITDSFVDPSVDLTSITSVPQIDLTSAADTGGGFLDALGSGIASAASSVGSWLTSGGGLNSLANLGSTYFKTQATTQQAQTNAQLQTAVLQAQVARTQAGLSPAPVSYVTNAAGQVVPVYTGSVNTYPALQSAIGAGTSQYVAAGNVAGYTVPSNMISTLGPQMSLTQVLPWLLLIGGALVLSSVL